MQPFHALGHALLLDPRFERIRIIVSQSECAMLPPGICIATCMKNMLLLVIPEGKAGSIEADAASVCNH